MLWMEIEKYSHVMHIVSHITGALSDDTQTEYEETLHKMGALMRAIDHAEESAGA